MTPTFDENGNITGFHSNRRKPKRVAIDKISDIYRELIAAEQSIANRKEGLTASTELLESILKKEGTNYDEFIFSL